MDLVSWCDGSGVIGENRFSNSCKNFILISRLASTKSWIKCLPTHVHEKTGVVGISVQQSLPFCQLRMYLAHSHGSTAEHSQSTSKDADIANRPSSGDMKEGCDMQTHVNVEHAMQSCVELAPVQTSEVDRPGTCQDARSKSAVDCRLLQAVYQSRGRWKFCFDACCKCGGWPVVIRVAHPGI